MVEIPGGLVARLLAAGPPVVARAIRGREVLDDDTRHFLLALYDLQEIARRSREPGRGDSGTITTRVTGMTSAQVADRLGCTRQHVTRLRRAGRLTGHRHGRDWVYDLDSYRSSA